MVDALLYGLAASSALVIGAAVGSRFDPPQQVTGVLLAFASGALISALAFELFEEAFHLGGGARSGLGLLAGAVTFVVGAEHPAKAGRGGRGDGQRTGGGHAGRKCRTGPWRKGTGGRGMTLRRGEDR